MTENNIIEALKDYAEKVNHAVFFQVNENGAKELYETLISALNFIYNLKADKEALIAGQETLQKAYEALKADEEREHQYCKNVCEPKYKAEIERLKNLLAEAEVNYNEAAKRFYKKGVTDFAERLKNVYTSDKRYDRPNPQTMLSKLFYNITIVAKELRGDSK